MSFRELEPMQEFRLYARDHRAWVVYCAEKWIRRTERMSETEKRSVWNRLSSSVRAEIKRRKEAQAA